MTPQQLEPIARHAHRQLDAGRCSCHVTAEQVAALTDAYALALERLANIATIADIALLHWCDHDRVGLREDLATIGLLAKLDKL